MKTAISLPDGDFERFEKVAAQHGLNRSAFYRLAGQRLADELEGAGDLTRLADRAIAEAGQPSGDGLFTREAARMVGEGADW